MWFPVYFGSFGHGNCKKLADNLLSPRCTKTIAILLRKICFEALQLIKKRIKNTQKKSQTEYPSKTLQSLKYCTWQAFNWKTWTGTNVLQKALNTSATVRFGNMKTSQKGREKRENEKRKREKIKKRKEPDLPGKQANTSCLTSDENMTMQWEAQHETQHQVWAHF